MRWGSIMGARAIQDQKTIAPETFVQPAVCGKPVIPSGAHQGNTIATTEMGTDCVLDSAPEKRWGKPLDGASGLGNVTRFMGGPQQSEILSLRQSPRIAFKVKGRIIFRDVAEIVAVHAAGSYVSLQHRPNPFLLRESLSSIAEKLKPYGFIRIHRSVIVNTLVVEEIQPLQTGEYRLRVKGGKEYMVARRYKDNLRHLAQLWLGSAPGERSKTS
jgi:LytTr DNA-binding domain